MNWLSDKVSEEKLDNIIYKLLLLLALSSCLSEPLCRNVTCVIFVLTAIRLWQRPQAVYELAKYKMMFYISAAFMIMLTVSAFYGGHFYEQVTHSTFWYCYNILLIFIAGLVIKTKKQILWLFVMFLISLLVVDGFILNQVVSHWKAFLSGGFRPVLWTKMHPMMTTVLYLVIVPIFVTFAFRNERKLWQRLVCALFIVLSVAALMGTGTRGAVLAILIVALLQIVYHGYKKPLVWLLLVSFIAGGGYFLSEHKRIPYIQRMTRIGLTADNSQHERYYMWQGAVKIFQDNPVFGVGLGNFGEAYKIYKEPKAHYYAHPHSNYMMFLTETGAIGFSLYLLFFGYPCYWGWKNRKSSFGIIIVASTLAWSIYATNDDTFLAWQGLRVYWLLLGLCIKGAELESESENLPLIKN